MGLLIGSKVQQKNSTSGQTDRKVSWLTALLSWFFSVVLGVGAFFLGFNSLGAGVSIGVIIVGMIAFGISMVAKVGVLGMVGMLGSLAGVVGLFASVGNLSVAVMLAIFGILAVSGVGIIAIGRGFFDGIEITKNSTTETIAAQPNNYFTLLTKLFSDKEKLQQLQPTIMDFEIELRELGIPRKTSTLFLLRSRYRYYIVKIWISLRLYNLWDLLCRKL